MRFTRQSWKCPKTRFYMRFSLYFLGYFILGILFSYLERNTTFGSRFFSMPSLFAGVFDTSMESGGNTLSLFDHFPAFFYAALFQALPIIVLFVLGLRVYEFFPFSRIWNLIFCASHGIAFEHFVEYLIANTSESVASVRGRILYILISVLELFLLMALTILLLQTNRRAAIGVPVPCLQRAKFSFADVTNKQQLREKLYAYLRTMLAYFIIVFILELILMVSFFAFRCALT